MRSSISLTLLAIALLVSSSAVSGRLAAAEPKHKVVFSICTDCGYRPVAETLSELIRDEVEPALAASMVGSTKGGDLLRVSIVEAAPAPARRHLARMVTALQLAAAAVVASYSWAEKLLHLRTPTFIRHTVRDKPFLIVMGAWILGSMAKQALRSTGAFEVSVDDRLVHSKLATGNMPEARSLLDSIEEALRGAM